MTISTDGETPISETTNRVKGIEKHPDVKHPDEDQLNPESFRLDQSELDQPVAKTALNSIAIRKPDRLEFFRIHPDPEYRMGPVPFISLKQSREYYLVEPPLHHKLRPLEYWIGYIFLAINREGRPFFWIVPTQSPTGRVSDWYNSALDAVDLAKHSWVQLIADQSAGLYTVALAEEDLGEPEWPELNFQELIRIGFKRRTVNSLEHAVFKQLRGRV
jgi:hypothetical protein